MAAAPASSVSKVATVLNTTNTTGRDNDANNRVNTYNSQPSCYHTGSPLQNALITLHASRQLVLQSIDGEVSVTGATGIKLALHLGLFVPAYLAVKA